MAENYSQFASDMARASAEASLEALRRQVYELNKRIDQIESRVVSTMKKPAMARPTAFDDGNTWYHPS